MLCSVGLVIVLDNSFGFNLFFYKQYELLLQSQINKSFQKFPKFPSDEVIDMFVERIIYRGVVDGNDEFVWVMNLSGECTDTSAKYKIRGYDKDYADSLKSDKNFNIVARMMIPMEECKRFCQEEAGRRFKKKYWNPITIKIAIA